MRFITRRILERINKVRRYRSKEIDRLTRNRLIWVRELMGLICLSKKRMYIRGFCIDLEESIFRKKIRNLI